MRAMSELYQCRVLLWHQPGHLREMEYWPSFQKLIYSFIGFSIVYKLVTLIGHNIAWILNRFEGNNKNVQGQTRKKNKVHLCWGHGCSSASPIWGVRRPFLRKFGKITVIALGGGGFWQFKCKQPLIISICSILVEMKPWLAFSRFLLKASDQLFF